MDGSPPAKRTRLALETDALVDGLDAADLHFSDPLEPALDEEHEEVSDAEVPAEEIDDLGGGDEGDASFLVGEEDVIMEVAGSDVLETVGDGAGTDLWEIQGVSQATTLAGTQRTRPSQTPAPQTPTAAPVPQPTASPPDVHYTPAAPLPAPLDFAMMGFATLRGKKLEPSAASVQRARALMEAVAAEPDPAAPVIPRSRSTSPAPVIVPAKRQREEDVFGGPSVAARPPARHPLAQMSTIAHVEAAKAPHSSPSVPRPGSQLALSQVEREPTTAPASPVAMPPPAVPNSAARRPAALTTPLRPVAVNVPRTNGAGFRPPFAARGLPSPLSTPKSAVAGPSTGSPKPATPRRLQLGMTPRSQSRASQTSRPSFATPFKNGVRPEIIDSAKVLSPSASGSQSKGPSVMRTPVPLRASGSPGSLIRSSGRSVFNLTDLPAKRHGLQAYGLQPPRRVADCLVDNISPDIIWMTLERAANTRFHGAALGPDEALKRMRAAGATYSGVNLAWVRNHYQLIVWKLAAIARAKPDEWRKVWQFSNVVDQLLYRYEREINLAHRSAIKRIQELDASPASPMILCVTALDWAPPDPEAKPDVNGIIDDGPKLNDIELTDGWYRMRAAVDEPLARACVLEKIRPGVKIAIVGARIVTLDKQRDGGIKFGQRRPHDGTDVLDAHDTTALQITGNSTTIAPGDAKLGFRSPDAAPYLCTLRSLTPDGGVVHALDLTITKLYPIGYASPPTENEPMPAPWSANEEVEKAAEYERLKHKAYETACAEVQAGLERAQKVADRIERAVDVRGPALGATLSTQDELDGESVLDDYDEATDKAAFLASLSTKTLRATVDAARQRITSLRDDAQTRISDRVAELCPPRQVRSFRAVRAVDYHETSRSADVRREALITVWNWDAVSTDPGVVVDGRYRVYGAVPSRLSAWAKRKAADGEVFLASTSRTRWTALKKDA